MKFAAGLLLFIFLGLDFNSNAETPNWLWYRGWNNSTADPNAITADVNGNVYVTGSFYGKLIMGTDTFLNNGSGDVCLVKYNAQGVLQWVKTAGGASGDAAHAITTDAGGYVYIAGIFYSDSIFFGSFKLTDSGNSPNSFIVKYDPQGHVVWAKGLNASSGSNINGIGADANSNIYVSGAFTGQVTIGNTTLSNEGVFTAKYDALGNAIWAQTAASSNGGVSNGISVDRSGNTYITGSFTQQLTFGTTTLQAWQGGSNIFVTKYDVGGNLLWAKCASVPNQAYANDYSMAISTDTAGNAYITGQFSSTMVLGSQSLTSANTNALFMAKYDSSGQVAWAMSTGQDNAYTFGASIAVNSNGNALLAGYFNTPSIVLDTITLSGDNGGSFVAEYNGTGHVQWAKSIGYPSGGKIYGVAADPFGNAYVTGAYGTQVFGLDTLFNPGVLAAKLGDGAPEAVVDVNNPKDNITIYPNPTTGNLYLKGLSGNSIIEIYNVFGQLIYATQTGLNDIAIILPPAGRGVYCYRISDGTEVVKAGKIVIE